jgi:hypothetical protein
VSVNDVLTLIVAVAAVAVPFAVVLINNRVDERSTRSALSDLTLKISERTAAYDDLAADKKFPPSREIETLVLQAEFMMRRLASRGRPRYPQSSVAATLAMALHKVNDFRWSDTYWSMAAASAEGEFKVKVSSYWGAALIERRQESKGRAVVDEALDELPSDDGDSCIVKADACLTMAEWDKKQAADWLDRARLAYQSIPDHDRREAYAPGGVAALTLQGCGFSGANLQHARLGGADLTGVSLAGADLSGADLTNSNLTDADLTGAVLTGADLTGAVIGPGATPPSGWLRDDATGLLRPGGDAALSAPGRELPGRTAHQAGPASAPWPRPRPGRCPSRHALLPALASSRKSRSRWSPPGRRG